MGPGSDAARAEEPGAQAPERPESETAPVRDAGADEPDAGVAGGPGAERARDDEGGRDDDGARDDEGGPVDDGARDDGAARDEAARGDEGGDEPPARRRSAAVIASVAAAVLLVGGGGAYLATSASGGSDGRTSSGAPGGDDTPPPLLLDGYSGGNGVAPGEHNPYGATYRADGTLPQGPGSAAVYRATGRVTQDEVARLARALGVDGTPVAEGQVWKVGPDKDGQGPSLQVNRQAPGAWTFSRYAPGTDNCQKPTVCAQDPASPAGDPVSVAAAMKAAAPVLKAAGQDDAKRDASQVMGAQRVVNADPVVGGLPTYGWTTGIVVGAQGEVVGGSGQLKPPVKGDTYPVVSAQKALELMNAQPQGDPRVGIGGCASPVPLKDRHEEPCGASTGSPGSSGSTGPGAPGTSDGTPAKETITVDKAVFGLASHTVDARQALVPSWLFEVRGAGARDAFTVTYPAVDPGFLATPTPFEEPTDRPSPRPSGPGDEPTPAPRNVEVEGYTAEGAELTVTFTGGVCATYEASASESADKVTVKVTETPWPDKVCILIAKQYQQTVPLDEPLGDREVVGSDGEPIPLHKDGARLPAPPSQTR
ncbi:hypothetical protein [Streptomyces bullii]|uniref:Large membrane protein n=1 Tax=Streptomyces bullii TaxID=349910 RepID=A0ABW0UWL1_9ACTN